jgi:hypothetical protein
MIRRLLDAYSDAHSRPRSSPNIGVKVSGRRVSC